MTIPRSGAVGSTCFKRFARITGPTRWLGCRRETGRASAFVPGLGGFRSSLRYRPTASHAPRAKSSIVGQRRIFQGFQRVERVQRSPSLSQPESSNGAVSKMPSPTGTEGSNPSPSSAESVANRDRGDQREQRRSRSFRRDAIRHAASLTRLRCARLHRRDRRDGMGQAARRWHHRRCI